MTRERGTFRDFQRRGIQMEIRGDEKTVMLIVNGNGAHNL
ncbi:Uncharacterised protein [Enterobacter cloacae]|nr:Uncharacterised protein [Enterobacter cloacae]